MKQHVARIAAHPATPWAAASLAPLVLIVPGALLGGAWTLPGLLSMTVLLAAGDRLGRRRAAAASASPETAARSGVAATVVGAAHFPALALAVILLSGAAGLGVWAWLATFLAFGLWFGLVANSAAHELIHRPRRGEFRLGMWIFISLLNGHHTSAHRLVHHRFVATPDDPSSAAAGESFYDFALRAWPGALVAGYEMENNLRAGTPAGGGRLRLHPYTVYAAGGAGFVLLAALLGGFTGVLAYLLLAAHSQLQILLSDYVQHYGLERRRRGPDDYEPFGPEHSWDAPDPLSALISFNAPRHADHHAHPARPFGALDLSPGGRAPVLPWSLPVMATVALVPPLWRRMMDPRVERLRRAGPG